MSETSPGGPIGQNRRQEAKGAAPDGAGAKLTLTVVAEAHLGLAKADCILSGADAIEFLEFRLLNILLEEGTRLAMLERGRRGGATGRRSSYGLIPGWGNRSRWP